jgi:acyl carrier protein
LGRLFLDRDVDLAALSDDANLGECLQWDSLDRVDLGLEFQHSLGVRLPDDREQVYTIAYLVGLLDSSTPPLSDPPDTPKEKACP